MGEDFCENRANACLILNFSL